MNYYERTIALVLVVLAMLIGLHFLPPITVGEHTLRAVNILSDIVPGDSTCDDGDWEEELLAVGQDSAAVDPVRPDKLQEPEDATTGIADYSDGAMERFCAKLQQGGLVRIAYFGDSFVEGDILTGPLREMLQARYGGGGVGFVDMATGMEGFRQTVRHRNAGFSIHAITDRNFSRSKEGINQRYFIPSPVGRSYVSLSSVKGAARATESTIYFVTQDSLTLTARVNGGESQTFSFSGSDALQHATVYGDMGQVEWSLVRDSLSAPCWFYGVTLDQAEGVVLDNFSMRSSSGATLASLPGGRTREFARLRPYDLIVLHFGLNVASEPMARSRYAGYQKQMRRSIALLREMYPDAALLIVSCSDRDDRDLDGRMVTLPGLRTLVAVQHQMARDNGIAFWNLFQAMGGAGSMQQMANASPAEANKDYTHLTHRGGRRLARLFFDVLTHKSR